VGRENRTGVYEIPQQPELADLFRVALRDLRLSLRTHTPATVVSYDPATQTATVTVDALAIVKDHTTPPTVADPAPTAPQAPVVLQGVPVSWPRTAQGYLTLPLAPGDTGELHVHDRSLAAWRALGAATDPIAAWTHSLADGVFSPGLGPSSSPIAPPTDATATVLDGAALIKVGRGATDFVALATLVLAELQKFELWASLHTHTGVVAGPGSTGTPALPPPVPGNVGATKAMAE